MSKATWRIGKWTLAKKVNHQGVFFPTPTHSVIEGMAVAAHTAFANTISLELDAEIKDWDKTNEHVRSAWYDASRASFCFLAVTAGAEVTDVPTNPDPDKN